MQSPAIYPVLPDCTLAGDGEKEFRRILSRHIGRKVRLDGIKRYSPPRSNQQNRAVMGFWMSIILEEQGYHEYQREAVYYAIKEQCFYEEILNKHTGEMMRIAKETRNLDMADYSQKFMEVFRAYVLDFFGIVLPDPVKALAMI